MVVCVIVGMPWVASRVLKYLRAGLRPTSSGRILSANGRSRNSDSVNRCTKQMHDILLYASLRLYICVSCYICHRLYTFDFLGQDGDWKCFWPTAFRQAIVVVELNIVSRAAKYYFVSSRIEQSTRRPCRFRKTLHANSFPIIQIIHQLGNVSVFDWIGTWTKAHEVAEPFVPTEN